jgi:hypothetical protein
MIELSTAEWAALGAVGTAITGAVAYLVKIPMDANRRRQEQLEADSREVAQLQKDYIKTATESSALNAATNAKQAADLATQAGHLSVITTAVASVSQKTDAFHDALREFVHFGRVMIKQLPSHDDQQAAQQHLNEIVSILGHKR